MPYSADKILFFFFQSFLLDSQDHHLLKGAKVHQKLKEKNPLRGLK